MSKSWFLTQSLCFGILLLGGSLLEAREYSRCPSALARLTRPIIARPLSWLALHRPLALWAENLSEVAFLRLELKTWNARLNWRLIEQEATGLDFERAYETVDLIFKSISKLRENEGLAFDLRIAQNFIQSLDELRSENLILLQKLLILDHGESERFRAKLFKYFETLPEVVEDADLLDLPAFYRSLKAIFGERAERSAAQYRSHPNKLMDLGLATLARFEELGDQETTKNLREFFYYFFSNQGDYGRAQLFGFTPPKTEQKPADIAPEVERPQAPKKRSRPSSAAQTPSSTPALEPIRIMGATRIELHPSVTKLVRDSGTLSGAEMNNFQEWNRQVALVGVANQGLRRIFRDHPLNGGYKNESITFQGKCVRCKVRAIRLSKDLRLEYVVWSGEKEDDTVLVIDIHHHAYDY